MNKSNFVGATTFTTALSALFESVAIHFNMAGLGTAVATIISLLFRKQIDRLNSDKDGNYIH